MDTHTTSDIAAGPSLAPRAFAIAAWSLGLFVLLAAAAHDPCAGGYGLQPFLEFGLVVAALLQVFGTISAFLALAERRPRAGVSVACQLLLAVLAAPAVGFVYLTIVGFCLDLVGGF